MTTTSSPPRADDARTPPAPDGRSAPDALAGRGAPGRERLVPAPLLLGGLTVALLVAIVVASGAGAFGIDATDIVGSVAHRFRIGPLVAWTGIDVEPLADPLAESVLWDIRFARVSLAVIVGASLACAGAAMQGSFSNPLAEPGIVGVSSGAALGASLSIVVGVGFLGPYATSIAAFIGGMATVLIVYASGRSGGRTEVVTLILTGVALNAMAGAIIGLLMYVSDDAELRSITFWNLGSLSAATWPKVAAVAPLAAVGLVCAMAMARRLDLLALGERPARHLGVDVERLRLAMLVVVAVLTAASVAVSGIILFIGLVVPHIVRMVAGPGHRLLIPASALGGAVLLVVGDLVARTVVAPSEIPLGVLTSLVGSPVFFWLLRRTRARQGGWA